MATDINARAAAPRWLNIAIGVWLFISAFAWPHSQAQMTNTWLMGVLCVVFAIAAMYVEQVRFLNTILAIWLFISAFALPRLSVGTTWNNAIVAIAIFIVSLIPSRGGVLHRRPRPV